MILNKVGIILTVTLCTTLIVNESFGEPAEPIYVTLLLSRTKAYVGEKTVLEEMIPESSELKFVSILHSVRRIGRYDKDAKALVNLSSEEFIRVNTSFDFVGLPTMARSAHGILFDDPKAGMKGVSFTIIPKRLGIYLITARWTQTNKVRKASNPIILTVEPPKGVNKLDPEWLLEEPGSTHFKLNEITKKVDKSGRGRKGDGAVKGRGV